MTFACEICCLAEFEIFQNDDAFLDDNSGTISASQKNIFIKPPFGTLTQTSLRVLLYASRYESCEMILRKGAIAAHRDEKVLIPINNN